MIQYSVTICNYKKDLTKKWFVKVNYKNFKTGEVMKGKQFKGGVNSLHTLKERTAAIQALKEYYEDKLKSGWNPCAPERDEVQETISFNEAIDFGLKKKFSKNLRKDTIKNYKNAMNHVKEAAAYCGKSDIEINQIKKRDIKLILDAYKEKFNASNKRYNIVKNYLSAVISELNDYEFFEVNPVLQISDLVVDEGEGYIRPSDEEMKLINDYLFKVFPNFCTYWKLLYDTGMRMEELLYIKVKDILPTWEVALHSGNTKTRTNRRHIISKSFRELITKHISGENPDYYVFGTFNNLGGKHKAEEYFCPAPFKIKRDTATKTWKKLVKDNLGLRCDMYGTKHKGGDDKLLAGISLDAVQQQYGHSSKFMTKRYVSKLFNVNKEELENKSPSL